VETIVAKYARKLIDQGLVDLPGPLIGGLDADLVWSRPDPLQPMLEQVVAGLDVAAILFARPAEPYRSLIDHLVARMPADSQTLCPQDSENRTFLHELPVVPNLSAASLTRVLKQRKCAIIPGRGIISYGTVSPEQAYIVFSSVCFSLFVKAFVDYCDDLKAGRRDALFSELIMQGKTYYQACLKEAGSHPELRKGPFGNEKDAIQAICEVGRLTVNKHMVDSFFGNVSYRLGNIVYISQTTSSLDELEGCIDPCALDDSRCTAITASSEYPAHKSVYLQSDLRAILHGHPKFSVIASLLCEHRDTCENNGDCHIKCTRDRRVGQVPILPGETGTGPYSIAATLPEPLTRQNAAIIYGHGVFTAGRYDFREAFQRLLSVEQASFDAYFDHIQQLDKQVPLFHHPTPGNR
jgi:ribulose-5-phosphate 4-epimerase/fuculose-1-phosphate aldolase